MVGEVRLHIFIHFKSFYPQQNYCRSHVGRVWDHPLTSSRDCKSIKAVITELWYCRASKTSPLIPNIPQAEFRDVSTSSRYPSMWRRNDQYLQNKNGFKTKKRLLINMVCVFICSVTSSCAEEPSLFSAKHQSIQNTTRLSGQCCSATGSRITGEKPSSFPLPQKA